jgi:hypothetical protein
MEKAPASGTKTRRKSLNLCVQRRRFPRLHKKEPLSIRVDSKRCYRCRRICRKPLESMVTCSRCRHAWHIECLDYPLCLRPSTWMCPLHTTIKRELVPSGSFILGNGSFMDLLSKLRCEPAGLALQDVAGCKVDVPEEIKQSYPHVKTDKLKE